MDDLEEARRKGALAYHNGLTHENCPYNYEQKELRLAWCGALASEKERNMPFLKKLFFGENIFAVAFSWIVFFGIIAILMKFWHSLFGVQPLFP